MTDADYKAQRAAIEREWAGYPSLQATLLADIDRAYFTPIVTEADIEKMSLAEFRAFINSPEMQGAFNNVLAGENRQNDDEYEAAGPTIAEQWQIEHEQEEENRKWADGMPARNAARWEHEAALAKATETCGASIRTIAENNPHLSPEQIEAIAPRIESLMPQGAPKSGVQQAREDLRAFGHIPGTQPEAE